MESPWEQLSHYLESYICDSNFWNPADDSTSVSPDFLINTPVYPLICDLIKSETRRSPLSLTIFLGANQEDFPLQIVAARLQELAATYTKFGRPTKILIGDWFDQDFNQEPAIANFFNALNTESILAFDIYQDYSQETLNIFTGYWQKNWQTYIHNYQQLQSQSHSWLTFRQNWVELLPCYIEIFVALQLDQHFLLLTDLAPLLPQLLADIFETYASKWQLSSKIAPIEALIAQHYQTLYRDITRINNIHLLELASSLGYLQDKSFSQILVTQFMQNWLQLLDVEFSPSAEIKDFVPLIQPYLQLENWIYAYRLSICLTRLNINCHFNLMNILYKEEFEFTTHRINPQGQIRRSRNNRARFYCQPLDQNQPNLDLNMVYIPSGILRMGSPRPEVGHETTESPMHWVALSTFFLGKFPITQAQWRVVAAYPQVNKHLDTNPSEFQGANRPVENISWYDAVEFCDRLVLKTGINYRLPTEAEWEYACRAGTKTPFHFGETIISDIVNYDASYAYGFGTVGEYRQQTMDVGSFNTANDYGLIDMHGQVLEWCADPWHDNYQNAPNDGRCWQDPEDDPSFRVLRGGSWFDVAGRCRAASRHRYGADVWLNHVGFRVALTP